jgi:hypothetical protein
MARHEPTRLWGKAASGTMRRTEAMVHSTHKFGAGAAIELNFATGSEARSAVELSTGGPFLASADP